MSKATAVYLLSTVAASASAKLLTPQDASSSTLAAAGITLHRDHSPGAVRCEELLVPMDDAGAKFLTDEFHVKGFAVGPCPPAYNAFNKRERDYLGFQDVEYRQYMIKDVGATEVLTLVRDHVVDTSDTTNDDHPDWFKFVHNYDNTHLSRFNMWSRAFQKIYATADEMREQFMKWAESDKIIRTTNEAGLSYTFGHNQFSDMTKAEFKEYIGGGFREQERNTYLRREKRYNLDLLNPDVQAKALSGGSVDWTKQGAVTGVKNQERCGSCWSFSTTGAIEGAYAIQSGTLTSLSEQQLVSCDKGSHGCNGGLMDQAFTWVKSNGGICSERDYPYRAVDGACRRGCEKRVKISGYQDVPNSMSALMTAISGQPVAVAINAPPIQHYHSGVFSGFCGPKPLDHGVLAVGYGNDGGNDYWKIKNSWYGITFILFFSVCG